VRREDGDALVGDHQEHVGVARADVAVADRVDPAGAVRRDQLDAEVREQPLDLAEPFLVRDHALVEHESLRVEPAAGARLAHALPVDGEVDRDLEGGEHLAPDDLPAALPGAEPHPVDDRAAADDEPAARERDEVLEVAVRADRGDGGLDRVNPHAVGAQDVVVGVELRLQPAEVGGAGGRRVVVLPLARVLGADLVLRRSRDEHLAQRPEPLCAPAAAPDLLDLVVEVDLVEHPVAQGLARLEPRERLEQRLLVVLDRPVRRGVRKLDRLPVGGHDPERHDLPLGAGARLGSGHAVSSFVRQGHRTARRATPW
jgi:hypothetical protein